MHAADNAISTFTAEEARTNALGSRIGSARYEGESAGGKSASVVAVFLS